MDDSARIKRHQVVTTLAAVTAVVSLVMLGLYLSDPSRRIKQAAGGADVVKSYRTPAQSLDPSEVWISRSEAELQELKHTNDELRRELTDIRDKIERLRRVRDEPDHLIGRTLPPPPPPPPPPPAPGSDRLRKGKPSAQLDGENDALATPVTGRLLPPPPSPSRRAAIDDQRGVGTRNALSSGILVVDLTPESSAKPGNRTADDKPETTGKATRHDVRNFLPAGAFAGAVMLSGLDAPTGGLAKTNPQPVLLRLLDHGTLPNRFRSRIRECFVTAAGYGDLASERAYLRLEKLSCVLRAGGILETPLKGFVTGEDGKAGLRGRVVSKQGQLIARAMVAGVAGGIGHGVGQSFTSLSTSALGNVQSVDPGKIAQYGLANGFASALDRISQWYLERANEVYPVLEVDAGRMVEVVLNEGLELGAEQHDETHDTGETP